MTASLPLRLGVIGLGAGAEPHLKSLADLAGTIQLVLAATPSKARAAKRRAELPCPVTTDVAALIGHDGIDAVIIITPPSTHRDLTVRCLAAGKHVLVEKPIGLTSADGLAMTEAAEAGGLTLAVMLQHRCRPGALRLRAALADGMLGEIAAAHCIVNWWRPQAYYDEPGRGTMARDGGGVLLTQAIHNIDLFQSLVGVQNVIAAQAVRTRVHRMETEDHVHALVTLANGAPGAILASTAAYPGSPERIEIFGAKGAASLIGGRLVLNFHDGATEIVEAEGRSGSGASIMDFPHDAHRAVIADFAAAVASGRPPAAPARDAVVSQQLIDRILVAASFTGARMP
jgi:predicted dehydrogenase